MRQFNAIAASTANSTALRFKTGSTPGIPRHTGHTLLFGGAPNCVEHEQKIFVAVRSWMWTSSPITASNLACAATEVSGVVAIWGDYIWRQKCAAGTPARPKRRTEMLSRIERAVLCAG